MDRQTRNKLTAIVAFGLGLRRIARARARICRRSDVNSIIGIRLHVISVSYLRIALSPNILLYKRATGDFKATGFWIPFDNTFNGYHTQTITQRRRQHLQAECS